MSKTNELIKRLIAIKAQLNNPHNKDILNEACSRLKGQEERIAELFGEIDVRDRTIAEYEDKIERLTIISEQRHQLYDSALSTIERLQSENTRLKAETETNRVRTLQYENLRQCFEQLTNLILGKRYYNEACDVYRADEYTCRDMWNKAKPIFSNKKWRGLEESK